LLFETGDMHLSLSAGLRALSAKTGRKVQIPGVECKNGRKVQIPGVNGKNRKKSANPGNQEKIPGISSRVNLRFIHTQASVKYFDS
jgi:hypothetical protein